MVCVPAASRHPRLGWLIVVTTAVLVGGSYVVHPLASAAIALITASLFFLSLGQRAQGVFLVALLGIGVGYAFMGRGFAHLGVPPVYIGELVLFLGIFAVVTTRPVRPLNATQWLIVLFMMWGATRTVPYIETYGFDALRDAAVWAYAAVALMVSIVVRAGHIRQLEALYRRLMPILVV